MKKLLCVVAAALSLALCLGLIGCVSVDRPRDSDRGNSHETTFSEHKPETESARVQGEKTSDEQQKKHGLEVTIDSAYLTVDRGGNNVIVVAYTWTNTSNETVSFELAGMTQAFQDGVELDRAYMLDYDSDSSWNDVRPGSSTSFEEAFIVRSGSEVEIEVTELWSWDDDLIAQKAFTLE